MIFKEKKKGEKYQKETENGNLKIVESNNEDL